MLRISVVGFVALIPSLAWADVGVALRRVPVQVTLTVDGEYPDFAFLLVEPERKTVRRVEPTPVSPAVVVSGDAGGQYFYAEVFVVPKAELAAFGQALPPADWFEKPERKYSAGQVFVRPLLEIFDNRKRIEQTYEVRRAGDMFGVELRSQNQGDRGVRRFWYGVCCGLPPLAFALAIALGGLWLSRRLNRKHRDRHRPPEG